MQMTLPYLWWNKVMTRLGKIQQDFCDVFLMGLHISLEERVEVEQEQLVDADQF